VAFVGPPVAGGIIGYFTNDLAIKMLFRPYRAFFAVTATFTPGLIPRNQERLAKRVSNTIMESLLTPEELQNLARRLLQPERVQKGISGCCEWLWINSGQTRSRKQILAGILRLGQSLPRLLKVLARREDFYKLRLTRSLVLLDFQLSEEQATACRLAAASGTAARRHTATHS